MTTPAIDPVPEMAGRPFIWFEPHQDDGLLWAWKILTHHALAGREVHVVAASDGSTSRVRRALNGEESNAAWAGGWHYPYREGYEPLTQEQFGEARDRELSGACGLLGVQPGNVHLEVGWKGPTLDVPRATELIKRYADLYPDAGLYTMWWGDVDPVHAALGTALRQLNLADPFRYPDCRWVVRSSQGPTAKNAVPYEVPTSLAATAHGMARNACLPYRSWNPAAGLFDIGGQSVPADFDAVMRGDVPNWIVKTAA